MTASLFPGVTAPRSTREQYRRRLQALILRHGLYRGDVHADQVVVNFPVPEGVHHNTIGAAFAGLELARLIHPIAFRQSERAVRHRGVIRVWHICDFQGARKYLKALASTGDDPHVW